MYAGSNPINFIDPTGRFRWRKPTTWQHRVIEDHIARGYGGPGGCKTHLEYPIPSNGIVDVLFFPYAEDQQSSFYPKPLFAGGGFMIPTGMEGYIYEIERYLGEYSVLQARNQAYGYLHELNTKQWFLYSFEKIPNYDWRNRTWHIGIISIPTIIEYIPLIGGGELAVWYAGGGAIMYANSRWVDDYPDRIRRLPPWVIHDWADRDEDSGLTEEQRQFIEMVNLAHGRQTADRLVIPEPVEENALYISITIAFGICAKLLIEELVPILIPLLIW